MVFRRGEIFWIENAGEKIGSEQANNRPGVIVSNNIANNNSPVITVCWLTRTVKDHPLPTHVVLESELSGTSKGSTVLCEQVISISKQRITSPTSYIGRVSDTELESIDVALSTQLGLILSDVPGQTNECSPDYAKQLLIKDIELNLYKQKYEEILERIMTKAKI